MSEAALYPDELSHTKQGARHATVPDLFRAAQARGFHRFSAYVLATNRRMLDLISRFGSVVERKLDQGVVETTFTARAPQGR